MSEELLVLRSIFSPSFLIDLLIGSPTCYRQIATIIETRILANLEDRSLCFHEVLEPHACQNLVVKCEALRVMITKQLHLSSALVCPNQGDVAMWVEGSRTNEREGMSSSECLLRQLNLRLV